MPGQWSRKFRARVVALVQDICDVRNLAKLRLMPSTQGEVRNPWMEQSPQKNVPLGFELQSEKQLETVRTPRDPQTQRSGKRT
jgi:hypothetical protein